MKSEILIYNRTRIPVSKELIRRTILGSLEFMKIKQPVEMAVLIIGNEEIRRINKTWRKKDAAANVLSFPQLSKAELKRFKLLNFLVSDFGSKSRKLSETQDQFDLRLKSVLRLGEIFINPYKIRESGARKKKEFEKELIKLLIHGLLHLIGHEHKTSKGALLMARQERKIIKNLN